ncbi:MAG: hypothetical protein ABSB38_07100 [Dehalococcoidia bacterium]
MVTALESKVTAAIHANALPSSVAPATAATSVAYLTLRTSQIIIRIIPITSAI